jgi:hypothetical protein
MENSMSINNTIRVFKDYEESENNFKILNNKDYENNLKNISNITTTNTDIRINVNIDTVKNFKCFIGIDVAKYKLDLYDTITNSHKTIKNNKEDILNYISSVNESIKVKNNVGNTNNIINNTNDNEINTNEILIIIDLTGGYEKLTLNTFYNNNFKNIILAEGLKVKNFKKSLKNNNAKTDKLDCLTLIDYGKHFHNKISLYSPQSEDRELINQLYNWIEARSRVNTSLLDVDSLSVGKVPAERSEDEMHEKVRDWFSQTEGVDIPESQELINELSLIPDMKINSQGKLYMLSKDEIKELNKGKSPDYMDSLCLTFAKPVIKKVENLQFEFMKVRSLPWKTI